ncbi:MAG: hypothetical protein P4L40_00050 [Terracidiphilus sp.]|nr:hypothetical protein [Terracidiphilus sp.]
MRPTILAEACELIRRVPGFPTDDPSVTTWVRGVLRSICDRDSEALYVGRCHADYCPKWDGVAAFRHACKCLVDRRRKETRLARKPASTDGTGSR